jgi:hypothetical protein
MTNQIPTRCPLCGGEIAVTRLYCRDCDTTIEGRFTGWPFIQLTPDQLSFIEIFIRCEGKIRHMQDDIGLSYPTIRSRLHDIIRALGYEPGGCEESVGASEKERQRVLEDLDAGRIGADEAMRLLKETEE